MYNECPSPEPAETSPSNTSHDIIDVKVTSSSGCFCIALRAGFLVVASEEKV
jgi:hypothetical protein